MIPLTIKHILIIIGCKNEQILQISLSLELLIHNNELNSRHRKRRSTSLINLLIYLLNPHGFPALDPVHHLVLHLDLSVLLKYSLKL